MKKRIALLMVLMMMFSSLSVFANEYSVEASVPKQNVLQVSNLDSGRIMPRSGTGYISGYFTVEDSDTIKYDGYTLPGRLGVKIIKGYFLQGMGSSQTVLIFDGAYSSQKMYVTSMGCQVMNSPSFQSHDNNSRYTAMANVQGDGSMTESRTMSLEATIELAVKAGVEVDIPGFGSASTEAEVREAFTGSTSKTISYTISTYYNSYYDLDLSITGMGKINLSVN